jgi:hypothetical protein
MLKAACLLRINHFLTFKEFTMILRFGRSFLLAVAFATATLSLLPVLAQSKSQVQFQRRSDSAKLSGTITGDEYVDYIVRARKGQTMSVSLSIDATNGNGSAFFNYTGDEGAL